MKSFTALIFAIFFMVTIHAQFVEHTQICPSDYAQKYRNENTIDQIKLKNTHWRGNIFIETTAFSISEVEPFKNIEDRWGTFISFGENTFSTNQSKQCGNDCFQSTIGKYQILENNQVEFFIEKITRNSYCPKETQIVQKSIGIFQMIPSKNGINFKKIS